MIRNRGTFSYIFNPHGLQDQVNDDFNRFKVFRRNFIMSACGSGWAQVGEGLRLRFAGFCMGVLPVILNYVRYVSEDRSTVLTREKGVHER